jgi:NTE family protein
MFGSFSATNQTPEENKASGHMNPEKLSDEETNEKDGVGDDALDWQHRAMPTIGLALGGGAARGWAHIGVLHAIREAGIEPDVIAGTSIGAVVGGCYTAGEFTSIEAFARSLSPRRILGLLDPMFGGAGLISGRKLQRLLNDDLGDTKIEDLPKRFVSVATELSSGHEIWLRRGSLVDSICASYALPGIFKPMQVNGRWLVDGALVNPVPVSVCRAYGARLVIAVSLNADFQARGTVVPDLEDFDTEETATSFAMQALKIGRKSRAESLKQQLLSTEGAPRGIPAVMMQAYNIIQDRITRSRLAGDPPDVMITPRMKDVGLFDFHKAAIAIDAGYEATQKAVNELREAITALT